jgi:hypothetical protein
MARSLNALFKGTNHGTRSRHTVYLFRQTDVYKELLIQSNAEMNNITEKTKEDMVLISKEELLKLHANKNCNLKD